ncbi:spore cortex biosynthesis protein YabQ [Risungbinella massiliensis]|uniref:spore cortex biosynthesis protein YabQ n=1 Tax=Risungbinella massiliensis TaxID=1329796 RepID=UPI0005CB9814|nr:spore cortex biosynthesis protein YabQ [Risungbinella massiliensis]
MNLATQWLTMGTMFGSGICLGIILDFYQVLKARFRLRGWIVSLIDLLYWFVSGGLVFSLLMWSNWGELRFYIFLAIALGIFLYYKWFHQSVFRFLRVLVQFIEQMVYQLYRLWVFLIVSPVLWLWSLVRRLVFLIYRMILSIGKGFLWPFEWMTRPLRRWLQPSVMKFVRKCKDYRDRLRNAWRNLIKKGDSE